MKEKIKNFFNSEKLKAFNKKAFNKKTITSAIVILVIVVALNIGYSMLFVVEGVVKTVDGSNITVANFLTTQTVNIGQLSPEGIVVGDRIKIKKNISGEVLSINDGNDRHGRGNKGLGFKNGDNGSNNANQGPQSGKIGKDGSKGQNNFNGKH